MTSLLISKPKIILANVIRTQNLYSQVINTLIIVKIRMMMLLLIIRMIVKILKTSLPIP